MGVFFEISPSYWLLHPPDFHQDQLPFVVNKFNVWCWAPFTTLMFLTVKFLNFSQLKHKSFQFQLNCITEPLKSLIQLTVVRKIALFTLFFKLGHIIAIHRFRKLNRLLFMMGRPEIFQEFAHLLAGKIGTYFIPPTTRQVLCVLPHLRCQHDASQQPKFSIYIAGIKLHAWRLIFLFNFLNDFIYQRKFSKPFSFLSDLL